MSRQPHPHSPPSTGSVPGGVQRRGDEARPRAAKGATTTAIPSGRDRRGTALGALDATVPPTPSTTADQATVLLVHDAPAARSAVSLLLSDEGFHVVAVAHAAAREAIVATAPSVVLLQLDRPEPGMELLRSLRGDHAEPIIILSPYGAGSDKARALELGADDYINTPFDPDELTARVRAVLRRGERHTRLVPPLVVGDLTIDFERRILSRAGMVVPLGRTEWLVLRHLARYPGKVVLNTELLSAIWGDGYADDLQVLRICISRLRHKLGSTRRGGGPIRTFHNVGYALEVD